MGGGEAIKNEKMYSSTRLYMVLHIAYRVLRRQDRHQRRSGCRYRHILVSAPGEVSPEDLHQQLEVEVAMDVPDIQKQPSQQGVPLR